MGYGDQMQALAEIQEIAKRMYDRLSEAWRTYPPQTIISAVSPEIDDIRRDLQCYLWAIEDHSPQEAVDYELVESLVKPDEARYDMALHKGRGFYILASPSFDRERRMRSVEAFEPSAGGEISVAVYVDGATENQTARLLQRVDDLVQALGYEEPIDVEVTRGSLFRRSKAKAQQLLTSEELRTRLIKVERGLELAGLEVRQAQVDQGEAEAVARLLNALRDDAPRACIRVGSILLLKYTASQGPVLVVRTLNQLEIRAMERYPEIQTNPEQALEALATAVDGFEATSLEGSGPEA
jgi:hypothetical protein